MHWQLVLDAASDLVTGGSCAGCARPGRTLCDRCAPLLRALAALHWPDPVPAGLPPPYAVAAYEGPVRELLLAHKEHARYGLARPLGGALAAAVAAVVDSWEAPSWAGGVRLVPPPSSGAVVRERDHDPVLRMACRAAKLLRGAGMECAVTPALSTVRSVADQAGLGATRRWQNLAGAYRVRPPDAARLARHAAVVVDDVITTGATAAEAARAISSVGGEVLGVAVVAATRRRTPVH